jgi:hypothetical protein
MNSGKTGFISRTGTSSTVYPIKDIIGSSEFTAWKKGYASELNKDLYKAYIDFLVNPEASQSGTGFEQKKGSGALMIKHTENSNIEQVVFLQAFITQKLTNNGYIINLAEEKQHENGDTSLIVYVKPSFKLPQLGDKADQLFGNIHMEIRHHDSILSYFKLIAHRYNDFRFDPGRSFAELMDLLFKTY